MGRNCALNGTAIRKTRAACEFWWQNGMYAVKSFRAAYFIAAFLLCAFSQVGMAAGKQDAPANIQATLAALREEWPEMAEALLVDGAQLEFRNGQIQLGRSAIEEVIALPEHGVAILNFLLAHEAWHSVQAKRRTAGELSRMREVRMLECEADFMGGAAAYRVSWRSGLSASDRVAGRLATAAFVRERHGLGSNSIYYPSADRRATTFELGWAQAEAAASLRAGENGSPLKLSEPDKAFEICLRISEVSDGAAGNLNVVSNLEQVAGADAHQGQRRAVTFRNYSARRILAGVLVLGRWQWDVVRDDELGISKSDRRSTAYAAITDEVLIQPNSSVTRHYFMPDLNEKPVDSFGFSLAEFPVFWGAGGSAYITAHYADAEGKPSPATLGKDNGLCYLRAKHADRSADRALLNRLGTIGLTVGEDFRPLGGQQFSDLFGMRRVSLIGGLARSRDDHISIYPSVPPTVSIVAFKNDDVAKVRAEFARLKSMFREVCGTDAMVEAPLYGTETEGDQSVSTQRFADGAFLNMYLIVWSKVRDPEVVARSSELKGAQITIAISRDLSW